MEVTCIELCSIQYQHQMPCCVHTYGNLFHLRNPFRLALSGYISRVMFPRRVVIIVICWFRICIIVVCSRRWLKKITLFKFPPCQIILHSLTVNRNAVDSEWSKANCRDQTTQVIQHVQIKSTRNIFV